MTLLEQIGEGAFGEVFSAELHSGLAAELGITVGAAPERRSSGSRSAAIGEVGRVDSGRLHSDAEANGWPRAAVKTSKSNRGDGAKELHREAVLMAQIPPHPNIVQLLGVVTLGEPLLLLVSFCEKGALIALLQKCAADASLDLSQRDRSKIGLDIAQGMAHLSGR